MGFQSQNKEGDSVMSEFKYISEATGETFELDGDLNFAQTALSVRGSKSDYELGYRSIESESMPARSASLEITFLDLDEADRFVSIIDADAEQNIPGKLVADAWEQRAALRGFDPSDLTPTKLKASTECCLLDGVWRKPKLVHMLPNSGDSQGTKRYAYEYPYKYASEYGSRNIEVMSKKSVAFQMCIFGPAKNPTIRIADNLYKINVAIPNGGYLLLDARDCSATLVSANGYKDDVYSSCARGQGEGCGEYAWERIPPGASSVSWDDTFGFDLTIFEERSAPPFGRQS